MRTSPFDWTGACRAPCSAHRYRYPGPRSPPWRRGAPPAWPRSSACRPTRALKSCRSGARWGSGLGGCPERTSPPECWRQRAHWYHVHVRLNRDGGRLTGGWRKGRGSVVPYITGWMIFLISWWKISLCWPGGRGLGDERRVEFINARWGHFKVFEQPFEWKKKNLGN